MSENPSDEYPEAGKGRALFVGVLLVVVLGLGVVSLAAVAGAALITFGTVGLWPTVQGWLDSVPIRLLVALSFLSAGFAFHLARRDWPRVFAAVEIAFALALAWVALGNAQADRLTIGLAVMATAFIIANGVQLWGQTRTAADKTPRDRFAFVGQDIRFYRGDELIAAIPRSLGGNAVYKIDFDALLRRVEALEGKRGA